MKRRKIKYLETVTGEVFEACPKGKFWKGEGYHKWAMKDQCTIKHLGRQIYLVGYFDFHKAGGSYAGQNLINQYSIFFPAMIKRVDFE